MAKVNINRKNSDPFYRYKMPKIIAKVEGRGNGIKTVVVNMTDICKSLLRPSTYTIKYLGCELGAQTIADTKADRYIVNGSHQADKLQDVLDGFIEKYVLCPSCENPETDLVVYPKKERIMLKCKACGAFSHLNFVHKINQLIFKSSPQKSEKSDQKNSLNKPVSSLPIKDTNHKYSENSTAENSSAPKTSTSSGWSVDTSSEAQRCRMKELEGRAKALTLNSDMERSKQERIDIFYSYVDKLKDNVSSSSYNDIFNESERLDIRDCAVVIVFEVLFSDGMVIKGIQQHQKLIELLTRGSNKAKRNAVGAVELLIEKFPEKLLPKVAHIFKLLYDLEIVPEDVFLKWSSRSSSRFVTSSEIFRKIHDSASPFISWLETAEEEEDSEDEVEIEFKNTGGPNLHYAPAEFYPHQERDIEVNTKEDFDDINIDDI